MELGIEGLVGYWYKAIGTIAGIFGGIGRLLGCDIWDF